MTTYSISLDDVDLALLPLRTHKYNDFLKKEHYQFQVMETDIAEEPEPTVLYTCHICAIEVPAAFAREHAASIKHRANTRIASVAAERTRALLTALPPPAAAQPTARFCTNCATTVGKNHEKTKEHRVAVMHDKLLWELMTAYVGEEDNDDESNYYDSEDGDTDLDIKTGISSRDCNGFRTWDKVSKEEQNECDRTVALPSIEATGSITEKEINKNEAKEDNQYKDDKDNKNIDNKTKNCEETVNIEPSSGGEKTEICTNDQSKEKETEGSTNEVIATSSNPKATQDNIKIEYVEFVTNDNKQVKVFSDHYHSFTRKVDTTHCRVCNSTFKNDEVDSHIFSLSHLNKMPSTLIDEHCVRQINNTYSHCILCNQMVKNTNVSKHYLTVGHGKREIQAVTATSNLATTSKTDKTTNAAGSANLDARAKPANLDVKLNTANVNGDVKVKPKTPETNTSNEAKSCLDWPVIYPYEVTKQESTVRCVICDCLVPNNPENRKGHLIGLNHAKNVKNKRNLYPYENTKKEGVARCVICDVKVSISPENLKTHITGLKHAKNVIIRKVSSLLPS